MFTSYKFGAPSMNPDPQSEATAAMIDQSGRQSPGQDTFGRASETQSLGNQQPINTKTKGPHEMAAERCEFPRLAALELFVGFNSEEITFLENKILYYLREAIRNFLKEIKQDGHYSGEL